MEEIGPPPPAPRAGPEPPLERWTTTLLILALTISTDAALLHSASFRRAPSYALGFVFLTWLMGNLVMFLPWTGAWALAGKVFRRRARFFGHLNTALLAGLAWTWLRTALDVCVFALGADAFRAVPYFLLLGAAWTAVFWGHLRLVSVASPRRLAGIAALLALFIVGVGSGARALAIRRMPAARTADLVILPHFLRIVKPVTVESHVKDLRKLQKAVDDRAKEL